MDYNNGKIYCIRNSINDEIYVGSTTQRLSKRFCWHKKDTKKQNSNLYKEMQRLGVEYFYIELIEHYPCSSKEELHKREGEIIREMATLNQRVSGRNHKEYYLENHEKELNRCRAYRENNREKEQIRSRTYYENNKEKEQERVRQYRENNKETENLRSKIYREENKDLLKEKRAKPIVCPCGVIVSTGSLTRHKRTQKHLDNLKNNIGKCNETSDTTEINQT